MNDSFFPKKDHWGDPIIENADFFQLPKDIGELITAYTDLPTDKKEPSKFWGNIFIGLFEHHCSYIGTQGFAFFRILKSRTNIIKAFELNFKNVTDLLSGSQHRNINFNYQNTAYGFEWSYNGKIIADFSNVHYEKDNSTTIDKALSVEYWINKFAEQQWTSYQLQNLDSMLKDKGYVEFKILKNDQLVPIVQLNSKYIKFLDSGNTKIVNKENLKQIFILKNKLIIEDVFYKQKLIGTKSGNRIEIPLMQLSNRLFFLRTLEVLYGYELTKIPLTAPTQKWRFSD